MTTNTSNDPTTDETALVAAAVARRVYEACWRAEGHHQEPWDWSVPLGRIVKECIDAARGGGAK